MTSVSRAVVSLALVPLAIAGALAVAVAQDVPTPPRAPSGKLLVRWFGQACFELTFPTGLIVLADPFETSMGYAFPKASKPDVVTISHEHADHNNAKDVAGSPKVLRGLTSADRETHDWTAIDETVKGVRIRTVHTFHDGEKGKARGKNAVFLFEDAEHRCRLVHLGDLGHALDEEGRALRMPTVLLIPVGGKFTIDAEQAKKVALALAPSHAVVPMHYKTKALKPELPLATVDAFLTWDRPVFDVRSVEGNELELDLGQRPAKPEIVTLGWEPKK